MTAPAARAGVMHRWPRLRIVLALLRGYVPPPLREATFESDFAAMLRWQRQFAFFRFDRLR